MTDTTAPTTTPPATTGRRSLMSPVMRHEMVDRFRGSRGVRILGAYVAVLGLLLWLLYLAMSSMARFQGGIGFAAVGRSMFESFLVIELGVVLFFGAGYAAAQIAGERERRTLSLLQITDMTPLQIVAGKWWAVTAWQVLLLVVGMPLAAASAFFGGVGLADVVLSTGYMIVIVASFSAVAILVSSSVTRTTTAIVGTYAALGAVVVGPGILAILEGLAREDIPWISIGLHMGTGLTAAAGASNLGMGSILTPFAYYLDEATRTVRPEVIALGQVGAAAVTTVCALLLAARRVRPGQGPTRRRRKADDTVTRQAPTEELSTLPPPEPR